MGPGHHLNSALGHQLHLGCAVGLEPPLWDGLWASRFSVLSPFATRPSPWWDMGCVLWLSVSGTVNGPCQLLACPAAPQQ